MEERGLLALSSVEGGGVALVGVVGVGVTTLAGATKDEAGLGATCSI